MYQKPFDLDFPPNGESLGYTKYVWESFHSYPLFNGDPGFPKQGKIGNCYWISPLVAVLANNQDQIKSLFIDHDDDFTSVKLCVDGEWQVIKVDHYFPFNADKQIAAFCKPINGSIWAMVLEKAWAKVYGSYKLICGGYNRSTLRTLTGASTNKFRTKDPYFDELISDVWKNGFPMCCNSRKEQENAEFAKNHAYSLMKINGQKITVRNPWGLKNQDIKNMSIEEFKEKFASVEICYFYKNFQYESVRVQSEYGQWITFRINVKRLGLGFFTINQRNKRFFRQQKELHYKISSSQLILCDENDVTLYQQESDSNKELWINWDFTQLGEYYIYCQVQWYNKLPNNFVFSAYSEGFSLEQCDKKCNQNKFLLQTEVLPRFIQRDYDQEQQIEESLLKQQKVQKIDQQEKQEIKQQNEIDDTEKDRACVSKNWKIVRNCILF